LIVILLSMGRGIMLLRCVHWRLCEVRHRLTRTSRVRLQTPGPGMVSTFIAGICLVWWSIRVCHANAGHGCLARMIIFIWT